MEGQSSDKIPGLLRDHPETVGRQSRDTATLSLDCLQTVARFFSDFIAGFFLDFVSVCGRDPETKSGDCCETNLDFSETVGRQSRDRVPRLCISVWTRLKDNTKNNGEQSTKKRATVSKNFVLAQKIFFKTLNIGH